MNEFFEIVENRLRNNYLLISGDPFMINELENAVYPPHTSKNKDFDVLHFFDEVEETLIFLVYNLCRKNDELAQWLAKKGIEYTETDSVKTLFLTIQGQNAIESHSITTTLVEFDKNVNLILKILESYVPVTTLVKFTASNDVVVFVKQGKLKSSKKLTEVVKLSGVEIK